MKVVWKLPDVERTWYCRDSVNNKLKVWKRTRWYAGPKNTKWWHHKGQRVEYYDCYVRRNFSNNNVFNLPDCSNVYCYWSTKLGKWRHKTVLKYTGVDVGWVYQQQGLCIERNLTSWVFRWRYRRTNAAIKIQRWYKGMYDFRCYKRAKAHFNSYLNYEPTSIGCVRDPNRKAGEETF